MAADGVGPSLTCSRLSEGILRAGVDINVLVNRTRMQPKPKSLQPLMPQFLSRIPYRLVSGSLSKALEAKYLATLTDQDIAWLWPGVSLATHEAVKKRNIPIIMEGINTRMGQAKGILDAAYDAFGAPPSHGITDARVEEEDLKIQEADAIFAPSPDVEKGLVGTALENKFFRSSYGTTVAKAAPVPKHNTDGEVTFLFCGYVCVRKGAHHLLNIWPHMPRGAKLRLVGRIEPIIAERYKNLLNSDSVEFVGFTRDVSTHYAASDVFVFPSLEEGDPLVTYEAAVHGLPIVASTAGAGRIGADSGCPTIVEPSDYEAFLCALERLYASHEAREEAGAAARDAVHYYDWDAVGARRADILRSHFPDLQTGDRAT